MYKLIKLLTKYKNTNIFKLKINIYAMKGNSKYDVVFREVLFGVKD